jgi:hypothetical protein
MEHDWEIRGAVGTLLWVCVRYKFLLYAQHYIACNLAFAWIAQTPHSALALAALPYQIRAYQHQNYCQLIVSRALVLILYEQQTKKGI